MGKAVSCVIGMVILCAGASAYGQTSRAASGPSVAASGPSGAAVGEAVKVLRESKDEKKWVEAAGVITRSSEEGAWEALRKFLADPEVLAVLKVRKVETFDSPIPMQRMWPETTAIFKKVALGTKGEETLLWLLKQKGYAEEAYENKTGAIMVRLLYDALQYVPGASDKLLGQVDAVLAAPGADSYHDNMMSALAAWGTKESLNLYKKYEPLYAGRSWRSMAILMRHRDRAETLKLLLEKVRNEDQPLESVDRLLGDTISMQWGETYALPPFGSDPKQAAAVADVLEDFRKDSGKTKILEEQKEKLAAVVAELRALRQMPPATGPEKLRAARPDKQAD